MTLSAPSKTSNMGAAASSSGTFGESFAAPTPACVSVPAMSASTVPSATASVAPHMFGEMPTPSSWHGTQATTPNYYYGHQTSVHSSCMQDGSANVSCSYQSITPARNDQLPEKQTHPVTEAQSICDMLAQIQSKMKTISENLSQDLKRMKRPLSKKPAASQPNPSTQEAINMPVEMPQCYGLHSLDRRSLFRADGTEHSYFTLTTDYPLERAVPEPMFTVYDDESDGCSNESVHVFTGTPEQLTYEEEDSACLNITSDVQLTLELQQQDDERACTCPVRKASDSLVTRCSQLSIEHSMRELRLLWDPGASAYLHSSKAEPPRELSYVAILFPKVLALCNQVGNYVEQQLTDQLWNLLVVHERRKEWDPGDIVDVLHISILTEEASNHLTECNSLKYLLQSAEIRHPRILSYFFILRYCSVKCNSWLDNILQYTCDQVEGLNPLSLTTPWDPGVLEIKDTMLSKSAVLNLMDLKHFRPQLLSQYRSWCATPNAFLQVLYCCLPIVLDCPYSETVQQFVCYFQTFSLTTDILYVMCSSTVTTEYMIVVLSYGKTSQEGSDAAVVYHVFKIQLPMSKTSHPVFIHLAARTHESASELLRYPRMLLGFCSFASHSNVNPCFHQH